MSAPPGEGSPPTPSDGFPLLGSILAVLVIVRPPWFKRLSLLFFGYTILNLALTA